MGNKLDLKESLLFPVLNQQSLRNFFQLYKDIDLNLNFVAEYSIGLVTFPFLPREVKKCQPILFIWGILVFKPEAYRLANILKLATS